MDAQRVVVIQDASKVVSSSALRWALHGLSLKPGDKLTLLAVLHQVNTPSTLSFMGGWKPLGYKTKVDSSSMFGANQKIVEMEATRKKTEYEYNVELVEVSMIYQALKVEFKIEVAAGPSPKAVALKSAENLRATWVILDRKMKKDKKYFLERLSCGISRMKSNNSIEQFRGPKPMKANKYSTEETRVSHVTYDEMMPGFPEDEDLFSIELFPTCKTGPDQVSQDQELTQSRSTEDLMQEWQAKEIIENSICTICKNRGPSFEQRKDFTCAELQAATDRFSSKNSLSEGRFGPCCRGQLESKQEIVVKKIASSQEEMDFKLQVNALCRARHENVVMLLGSCTEGNQRLLAYEYAHNGSLKEHLSKHHTVPFTWTRRMKIALGLSRGLNYLHQNNIIHRDLRPSNIFLTHDFEPLIGDFGLLGMQSDKPLEHKNVEAYVYLAPEYLKKGELSTKTNVYSFGVVLLELITGRRETDRTLKEKSFVTWARPLLNQRKYLDLVDSSIANSRDVQQLYRTAQLAEKCLSKYPKKRLSMDEVVSTMEYITERKSCFVTEDFPSVESYLVRSVLDFNDSCGYEKTVHEQESSLGEVNITSQMTRSFSSNSSTTSSFYKSFASSGRSFARAKSSSKIPMHYAEMFN